MNVFTSATKIVLLLMTAAVVAGLFLNKIDSKDFVQMAMLVLAFYFGGKQSTPPTP